jgi:hypothetical protein
MKMDGWMQWAASDPATITLSFSFCYALGA